MRPGYKQTVVGVIPNQWEVKPFSELFAFRNGVNADKAQYGHGVHFINVLEPITYSHIHGPEITGQVTLPESVIESYTVRLGDVLFNRTSETQEEVALAAAFLGTERVVFGGFVIRGRPNDKRLDPVYSGYALRAPCIRSQIIPLGQGAIRANVGQKSLGLVVAPLPPLPEQRAIAEALSDMDQLLGALDRLITKKRDLRQAAMQQLLTGQTRLPSFRDQWRVTKIADIATPSPDKNSSGAALPVLTCSKHLGFMDSLGFFKNQVFSKDLSTYRIIRKGQIGYPANHVEEGSIGLQDLYDVALVSPIYVVFSVGENLNSFFLHRLLKLDSYRVKFKTATTSSVDRRGSLRWPAFSQITVSLPPLPEQIAIAEVLGEMEEELAALERRREKTRALKQGMMQELLTGRTRLV